MALDQVEVMKHFGFDRFPVVGQDRGGRVGAPHGARSRRQGDKLAVLDIVPTHYLYTHVTKEFIQAYLHWFNNVRPAPGPENEMKAAASGARRRRRSTGRVSANVRHPRTSTRCARTIAPPRRSIETRRGRSEEEDRVPLLALWSEGGRWAASTTSSPSGANVARVSGKGLSGGHNLQEDVPKEVLAELTAFL